MASFGKAFDESFKTANAQSIAGAYDLMKQKIQLDQAKAQQQLEASTVNHAAIAAAIASGDKNLIKNTALMVDSIGNSTPEASKLIFSSIQDRIKAQQTQSNQEQSYAMRSGGLQPTQPSQMNDWNKQQVEANTANEMNKINPNADLVSTPPALIGGKPYSPIPGFKTPAQAKAESITSDAKDIAQGIKEGTQPPVLTGLGRTGLAGEVRANLARQGVDYSKLVTDWTSTQALAKNLNSTQQLRMNQALNSVQTSIEPLRGLSQEVERVGFVPANKLIIGAKLNGIGLNTNGLNPDQVKVATKYVSQINLMRDELAQGFMGGGVPTETAFKLTDGILNPAYSKGQLGAALDQLQVNLNIRRNAIASTPALMVGGNGQQPTQLPTFGSEADARKAGHKSGDRVVIGGVSGTLN